VRDVGAVKCGIVSFTVEGVAPQEVRRRLSEQHINVSVSIPEYTLLDMRSRNIDALVRTSVHYYNTEAEIERFCQALASIAAGS